jgi:transcriptional regulator with XRE-family HTH domain
VKGSEIMSFQENLRYYREKAGYKQAKDFAKVLDVPYPTYVGYESQGREPKYETLCKIADLLHVSTDDLLGRTTNILGNKDDKQIKQIISDVLSEKTIDNDIVNIKFVNILTGNINFEVKINEKIYNVSLPKYIFVRNSKKIDEYYYHSKLNDIEDFLYYYAVNSIYKEYFSKIRRCTTPDKLDDIIKEVEFFSNLTNKFRKLDFIDFIE